MGFQPALDIAIRARVENPCHISEEFDMTLRDALKR
jgi:hypothetical protein